MSKIARFRRCRASYLNATHDLVLSIEEWHAGSDIIMLSLFTACFFHLSFSELTECQVPIASRIVVLQQVICISLSECFSCSTSVLVAEVFLCLAHSPQTHQHLMVHGVIDGLLEACRMRPLLVKDLQKEQLLLVALK